MIFRSVTLGHQPPMTGFHIRFFVVLVLAFVIFVVVFVVIIKERTQQPNRGERESQVEIKKVVLNRVEQLGRET